MRCVRTHVYVCVCVLYNNLWQNTKSASLAEAMIKANVNKLIKPACADGPRRTDTHTNKHAPTTCASTHAHTESGS